MLAQRARVARAASPTCSGSRGPSFLPARAAQILRDSYRQDAAADFVIAAVRSNGPAGLVL